MRAAYIVVKEDGNIISSLHSDSPPSKPGYIRVSDMEQIALLARGMPVRRVLYKDGRVVEKAEVEFIYSSIVLVAGEGVSDIALRNVPEEFTTVKVKIGNEVVELPRDETIEVSSTVSQHIMIEVVEPTLWSEVLHLRFIPETN